MANKRKRALLIICFILLVQSYDFSDILIAVHNNFSETVEYSATNKLKSDLWNKYFLNYKHICFMGEKPYDDVLGVFGIKHGMTINDFYMARKNTANIQKIKNDNETYIKEGNVDKETIYVFNNIDSIIKGAVHIQYYCIDGYIVGVSDRNDGLENKPEYIKRIIVVP
jgi:hypothetical protein